MADDSRKKKPVPAKPSATRKKSSSSSEAAEVDAASRPPVTHVYRWDLDKTYLKTDFDTFRDLLRSAFEGAEKKQTVPGAAALLRELRKAEHARVCFISGSPRQMRRVLTRKLQLDGVEFDEFILKPNLTNLFKGRFRALRDQVGYKLPALLAGRAGLGENIRETCFGDDAEADAFVYSLYADLVAGRVDRAALDRVLELARVYPDDAARTHTLAESLPRGEAVSRIYIRLDRRSPTARFDRYGPRLVPVYNYFQAALVLYEDQRIDADALARIALDMIEKSDYTHDALRNSLQDLLRRGRLKLPTARGLGAHLAAGIPSLGALPPSRAMLTAFGERIRALEGTFQELPPEDGPIDYVAAFQDEVPRHRGKPSAPAAQR